MSKATHGAKHPQFAPFSGAEPASGLPTYGAAVTLGELVKVTDSPNYSSQKLYGDNRVVEQIDGFKDAAVNVEVTQLDHASAAAVFGATVNSVTQDLEFGDDNAPWGGFGFYVSLSDGTYRGIFYPKCKATVQGTEHSTDGDSIAFANKKLLLTAILANNGRWKMESEALETEAAAQEWIAELIKPTA